MIHILYQDLQFAQHERDSLIGHLVGRQQSQDTQLVLTPRQRQALEEEARLAKSAAQGRSVASSSSEREKIDKIVEEVSRC